MNSGDQVETQRKPLPRIAIPLTQDPKHLQFAKNMFNQNPFTSQAAVLLLFFLCQRMIFGFLERCLAVFMELCQPLVTSICQNTDVFRNLSLLILEQLKIVFASTRKSRCHNFGRLVVGNQLRFLGMSPLFATVMPILAFFGHSIGCSLTSTSTTSKIVSLGWSVFLPGRRNFFERASASSTLWMVRHTADSLMP